MRVAPEAPDIEFVQEVLAQLPWYYQLALLDKLLSPETRRWYAAKAGGVRNFFDWPHG